MSKFYFRFIPDGEGNPPPGCCFGEVCIGLFRERFLSDVTFWRRVDYEKQWASAASSVLSGNKAGLIVSLPDPSSVNFVRLWAMYREGEVIFLQEQICFLDELSEKFDPDMVDKFVRSRETTSEDGQGISEWSTTVSAVRGFLDRQPSPDC